MAVAATPLASRIRLQFQVGVDGEGNPLYTNKTLNRVKTDALDQDVFDVALALGGLSADTLNTVTRISDTDLAEGV